MASLSAERTAPPEIRKSPRDLPVPPNMADYASARAAFSWDEARRELDGLPGGRGLNIAHEAVDRHVAAGLGERPAIRWMRKDGPPVERTYAKLAALSSRFANVLRKLGVGPGDRVFGFSGRVLALYAAVLGTLKNRSVFCPLFSAFGPEPAQQRLALGEAKVLVTTAALYRKKIAPIRASLPGLEHVLLTGTDSDAGELDDTLDLDALMDRAAGAFEIPATDPEDPALLHFTSGTTGTPKGALHVHEAVVAHHATGRIVLDLHADDAFWCTADPGWVTGTSYGIIAPLTNGVTSVVDEGEFDAARWYRTLQDERVTVWYTAPTAVRRLMRAGPDLPHQHDLSSLRFIASVGEPLDPEAILWAHETLGLPIHDNWWQTETGGIMIAPTPRWIFAPARWASPYRESRRPSSSATPRGISFSETESRSSSTSRGSRGSSPCAPAGPRCSGATCSRRSATGSASPGAGTAAATSRAPTPTATSGSSGAATT